MMDHPEAGSAAGKAAASKAGPSTKLENSILVIRPYKISGLWVFDDERVGLVQEPFVSGADVIIDHMVRDIPDADSGFTLLFSANPFPGYQARLEWVRSEFDGNWYEHTDSGMQGWLCPALFKYFDKAPKQLFARFEPKAP